MPDDDPEKQNGLESRLNSLRQRRAQLGEKYDDEIRWLREVASLFSDTEEQQRIVGDINETREQMVRVEEEIWRLESRILDG
jgi:hypothetical protein